MTQEFVFIVLKPKLFNGFIQNFVESYPSTISADLFSYVRVGHKRS